MTYGYMSPIIYQKRGNLFPQTNTSLGINSRAPNLHHGLPNPVTTMLDLS